MNDILKKIDHASILSKRIQKEMSNGNIDNAVYLTDTFIFLFSSCKEVANGLIEAYITVIKSLIKDSQIDKAEVLVTKALLLKSNSQQLISNLVKVKEIQRNELRTIGRPSIKKIAFEFIEKHIPDELSLFKVAWRAFSDILPDDFNQLQLNDALGMVGKSDKQIMSPHVIILLNILSHKRDLIFSADDARKVINNILNVIDCPIELSEMIIHHYLKEFQ